MHKKFLLLGMVCITMTLLSFGVDAANECPNNATPVLQNGDPSCWTSKSSSYSYTCTWDCTGPYYACDGGVQGTSPSVGTNCKSYLNSCTDSCGNYWGCSNRTDGGHGTVKTYTGSTTSYTCYYTIVDEWSTCNATTGIRYATSLEQKSTSGKKCDNLNETRTQACGVCTPATNIDVTRMPTKSGICAFGTPTTPVLANDTWTWKCLGANNTIADDDASCSAPNNVDGACNSTATGTYAWNVTAFRGTLCAAGTPTINPNTSFPSYGQTVTWGCNGVGRGTSTSATACRAMRQTPQPGRCASANGKELTEEPKTDLCCDPRTTDRCVSGNSYLVTNSMQYNSSTGTWSWTCNGEDPNDVSHRATCAATCVPNIDLDVSPNPFLLTRDGVDVRVTVRKTGACEGKYSCTINGTSGITHTFTNVTRPLDIIVRCTNGTKTIDRTLSVGGYCVARSCTAQGSCQAIPKPATSINDCTSTCSSDADCSTGRMIETRP